MVSPSPLPYACPCLTLGVGCASNSTARGFISDWLLLTSGLPMVLRFGGLPGSHKLPAAPLRTQVSSVQGLGTQLFAPRTLGFPPAPEDALD